jgi:hypothetical protein
METDITAASTVETELAGAERLAAHRFPEVAVERRYVTEDGTTARAVWVCRAPSEAHLGRWAESAELNVTSVGRITADHGAPQEA